MMTCTGRIKSVTAFDN